MEKELGSLWKVDCRVSYFQMSSRESTWEQFDQIYPSANRLYPFASGCGDHSSWCFIRVEVDLLSLIGRSLRKQIPS